MHSSVSSENKKTVKKKNEQGFKQISLDSFMLKTEKGKRLMDSELIVDLENNVEQKAKKQKVIYIYFDCKIDV